MGYLTGITKDILNSCLTVPVAGLESEAYILNRKRLIITVDDNDDNLINSISNAPVNSAYKVTMANREFDVGSNLVTADDSPDLFSNYFKVQPYQRDAGSQYALDNLDDIVAIVELKGAREEGKFVILGLKRGLHKISSSIKTKDNFGMPIYEFSSQEGETEEYSRYVFWNNSYEDSKAMLEDLLILPVGIGVMIIEDTFKVG